MELTYPVQRYIEDNINLIENDELSLFFYGAIFALNTSDSENLVNILTDVLNIDPKEAIKSALVDWCRDNVALNYRGKIAVSKLLQNVPRFGYTYPEFFILFRDAVKTAYPNKVVLPDRYGVAYVVEKI